MPFNERFLLYLGCPLSNDPLLHTFLRWVGFLAFGCSLSFPRLVDGAVESSTFRAVAETACIRERHYSIVDDDYILHTLVDGLESFLFSTGLTGCCFTYCREGHTL